MKKVILFLMSLVLAFGMIFSSLAFADEVTTVVMEIDNSEMTVNGQTQGIDENGSAPIIIDGRTLVPIRAMIEALGGTVAWNGESRTAVISYENSEIQLIIDSNIAYLNGDEVEIDVAPVIINNRTMLPTRFIAESFGFEVSWEAESKTITIVKATTDEEVTEVITEEATEEVTEEVTEEATEEAVAESQEENSKVLVVYYSTTGNTESLAETIHSVVGGDIVKIETVEEYPEDYNTLVDIADEELAENARPEISTVIDNFEDYDTVYIGYPIWWGTMPMAMFTFIESYDFEGKVVVPFCTSGSSGISTSVGEIRNILTNATVTEGYRGSSNSSAEEITDFIEELEIQ